MKAPKKTVINIWLEIKNQCLQKTEKSSIRIVITKTYTMNFYKKAAFIFVLIVFGIIIIVKSLEPVIEKQLSQIFSDRKVSNKIDKELINLTKDFTPEKRVFYKKILVSIYSKWIPLFDEAKAEAKKKINKDK